MVPRYLYVVVLSRFICPSLNGVSGCVPIVMVWLFPAQILGGIFLIFHRLYLAFFGVHLCFCGLEPHRPSIIDIPVFWLSPIFVIPVFSSLISLARFAYSITDNTPPCLMLSLVWLLSVWCFHIWFRFSRLGFCLCFLLGSNSFSFSPLLLRAYSMAFSHALSYAFLRRGMLCVGYGVCVCLCGVLLFCSGLGGGLLLTCLFGLLLELL